MEVRCKKCPRSGRSFSVEVFQNRPGNGVAVNGTGSSADFIQENQTPLRCIVQDVCKLQHLDHEGTLSSGKVVRCTNPRKHPVHNSDAGKACRDKRTGLRHNGKECNASHVGGFTCHVCSGENQNLLFERTHLGVVRDISSGNCIFYNRVASVAD